MAEAPRSLRPKTYRIHLSLRLGWRHKLARLKTPIIIEAHEAWLDVSHNLIESLAGGL